MLSSVSRADSQGMSKMNINDPVGELLHTEIKTGWIDWAAEIVNFVVRHFRVKSFVRRSKKGGRYEASRD